PLNGGTDPTDFNVTTANTLAAGSPRLPSYRPLYVTDAEIPYAYFSSYEGRGYKPHDCNFNSTAAAVNNTIPFQLMWRTITTEDPGAMPTDALDHARSVYPNPYAESSTALTTGSIIKPFNPQTFQILHPGTSNSEFGIGGTLGRQRPAPPTMPALNNSDPGADDMTNFSDGRTIGDFNESLITK
ncbi:MAG: hypothetical protein ACRDD1_13050, partial [Planctomycetia bacterium]